MSDERSPDELGRTIDYIRDHYVTEKVFEAKHGALADRVLRIEQSDTAQATGNRNWMLGAAQVVLGVVLSAVAGVLMAKGGH